MEREIKALKAKGYQVEELTPYQYRVECVLDLYPTRKRFTKHAKGTENKA